MKPVGSAPRVLRQWLGLLAGVLVAATLAQVYDVFWRADLAVYDAALPSRPAPDDIVIVAIDEASLAQLGRWPWSRTLHARLMEQLTLAGARAVAIDILFVEPDAQSTTADAELASAIARGPPTVLPLAVDMPGGGQAPNLLLPIPPLAKVSAAMGHVHLELDRDGMGRSVFLREGRGDASYPHLVLALLEQAPGEPEPVAFGQRRPDSPVPADVWVRDYRLMIPFLGPPGHFSRLSYVDVLRGDVPAHALRDKLVLVGVTAQGTGDAYPTPRSGHGVAMPGVEISANVLATLRARYDIRPVAGIRAWLLTVLPLIVVAIGYLRLTPRLSLILTGVVWLTTLGTSVLLLQESGFWWPPVASLAALLVMYPLWSWRRLEATQSFLDEELARLSREHFPLSQAAAGESAVQPHAAPFADVVERRIEIVRRAVQRARDARRLLADTLRALPGATFLVDNHGRVVLSNPSAAQMFGVDESSMEGTSFDAYLSHGTGDQSLRFTRLKEHAPASHETVLRPDGRHVLVSTVPFTDGEGLRAGTIIEITDISELRAAQREREDALRFLSHDMKSPASSLLSLAQLQRDPAQALQPDALAMRLDSLAQRLLALVDGFVGLARAEAVNPQAFEYLDLRDAIQDACDEVWAVARSRRIALQVSLPAQPLPVHGDRTLLARAFINLLGNALKFSPEGTRVAMQCRMSDGEVSVDVEDSGPGIADEDRVLLFHRFTRRVHRGDSDPGGAGLGLAFVRVVAEKHGGRVGMESAQSGAAMFTVVLPLSVPPAPA